MCSIVGSYNIDKLQELLDLNRDRGVHSHSLAVFDEQGVLTYISKSMGPLQLDKEAKSVFIDQGCYFLAHQQAPTTEARDYTSIHPADTGKSLLWHNGIIKSGSIREMQEKLSCGDKWDTKLVAYHVDHGWDNLNDVDGSFACVRYNYNEHMLTLFRNKLSPLFFDDDLNISSTEFRGSISLEAERVHQLDLINKTVVPSNITFKTKDTFYIEL